MSAFTFTAPVYTLDDEIAEREALSPDERRQIHCDLYGTDNETVAVDTNSHDVNDADTDIDNNISQQLELMRDALESLCQTIGALAYQTALTRAPELVERESTPLYFLQHSNYDPVVAAQNLVHYWDARYKIFGDERCFLQMTLDGAMADDLAVLQKGCIFETVPDRSGRPVLFLDRIRCTSSVGHRDSIARCIWYAFRRMLQKETARKHGCVGMVNYRGLDLYKHFDRILTKKITLIVNNHPFNLNAAHVVKGPGASVTDIVLPVLKKMFSRHLRLRTLVHSGSSSDVLQEFADYGLGAEHVDCFFAGMAKNMVATQSWLADCRKMEEELGQS